MFESSHWLPEAKRVRLEQSWAGAFRRQVLPRIDEAAYARFYCADNGRPNKPVRVVVGVLLLKELFALTDEETLHHVEYDLSWHYALGLQPETAHECQKTLHNFRARLLADDEARRLFAGLTDKLLGALGLATGRQRLDSTAVVSNAARLTRLGLFVETVRLFLRALQQERPAAYAALGARLRGRYLKEDGAATKWEDAKVEPARRRLAVGARDAYRLWVRFQGDAEVGAWAAHQLLGRLVGEQCEVRAEPPAVGVEEEDYGEEAVPVVVKERRTVQGEVLQTPHDPGVTYSGHKGAGYAVQVAETVGNGAKPELLTAVAVTPLQRSDAVAVDPLVAELAARGLRPAELLADTTYASTANVVACAAEGTELVGPAAGPKVPGGDAADSTMDVSGAAGPRGPAGCAAVAEARTGRGAAARVWAEFRATDCAGCGLRARCPGRELAGGGREWQVQAAEYVLRQRRRYEATEEFRRRYAWRAGIEGTNSELKRGHGLGRLRVRGAARVRLAVYLKALGCNVKRAVKYWAAEARRVGAALFFSVVWRRRLGALGSARRLAA